MIYIMGKQTMNKCIYIKWQCQLQIVGYEAMSQQYIGYHNIYNIEYIYGIRIMDRLW
jgi:hypothetical protein